MSQNQHSSSGLPSTFVVNLPGGGELALMTQAEVNLWDESMARYLDDYQLTQQNDKILVGSILAQQLVMFRAQQRIAGMVPEFDSSGAPTGRYVRIETKATEMSALQQVITKTTQEIRETEKALGIDKKTRESGGGHDLQNYVKTLKKAARQYGLHLSVRLQAYESFNMDLRQRLRILENADEEDRRYMGVSEEAICKFAAAELAKLEQVDKDYAHETGSLYLGQF